MSGDAQRLRQVQESLDRPDPVIHPDNEGFWKALERGELRLQRCAGCAAWRFPPGPVCHHCQSFEHRWEPLSPDGRVAAAVVVRRATGDPIWGAHVPFASGVVDLEHGLRLPGRILCSCGEGLRRGSLVQAVVLTASGHAAVMAFAHACVAGDA